MKLTNESFTEKYRPKTFDEVIGTDVATLKKLCENPVSMPHLLLHSKVPGTGKSSIAKVIVNHLGAESLFMNASDERRIEDIREKVKRFVQCIPNKNVPRIVVLDEADGMTSTSQEALRSLMEQFSAKFILTCNRLEKVIEPLQSRCTKFHLGLPKKQEILVHIQKICEKESIQYEVEALKRLIDFNYPSIRDVLNQLQLLSLDNKKITLDRIKQQDSEFKEIFNMVQEGKLQQARQQWIEQGIDLKDLLKSFFDYIWNGNNKNLEVINLLNQANYQMAVHADSDIVMTWFCVNYCKLVKNGS
ncbi:MAG: AAA family ATPase [archaeon]|nr:AAA family ATPase [archaeon]